MRVGSPVVCRVNTVELGVRLLHAGAGQVGVRASSDVDASISLFRALVDRTSSHRVGLILDSEDDLRLLEGLECAPAFVEFDVRDHRNRTIGRSLLDVDVPIRLSGFLLDFDDDLNQLQDFMAEFPVVGNDSYVVELLAGYVDPFIFLRNSAREFHDDLKIADILSFVTRWPVSLTVRWMNHENVKWFLGQLPNELGISIYLEGASWNLPVMDSAISAEQALSFLRFLADSPRNEAD